MQKAGLTPDAAKEIPTRLDRIATATEKSARRRFWIALPIYRSVAAAVLWVGFFLLVVARGR